MADLPVDDLESERTVASKYPEDCFAFKRTAKRYVTQPTNKPVAKPKEPSAKKPKPRNTITPTPSKFKPKPR